MRPTIVEMVKLIGKIGRAGCGHKIIPQVQRTFEVRCTCFYYSLALSTTSNTSGRSIPNSFNFSTVGTLFPSQPRRL